MKISTQVVISSAMFLLGMHSAPSLANEGICGFSLESRFVESAPRDSFVFSNQSDKPWNIKSIRIDMNESVGKLIFDTIDGGDGVEVYQPFQVSSTNGALAEAELNSVLKPGDGDQDITLNFSQFTQASGFSFTIDVDDQLTDSDLGQIRVSGGEVAGSILSVTVEVPGAEDITLEGKYSSNSLVKIASDEC